jgi:predicted DNA repair protein MutK
LAGLSVIGTAAMLWVGGGILLHGMEEMHLAVGFPEAVHHFGRSVGSYAGPFGGLVAWFVSALAGAVLGLVIGGIIAVIVRRFTRRPEELIVD